eukprot:gnl/MRDRNA2_/MRDRNA2_93380_c0_seq1.p1 gnl/MRDRNA2_/MRDRNA2_93380_c0~~gnl/MRDRNA2_/MRDRNA2_93380_c0_seq1.p1  ORF type:complete len:753 (+),score=149.43 gnl/MRDRNA2_/MRDRNA2_93380_c0_seq1:58-2259(+)
MPAARSQSPNARLKTRHGPSNAPPNSETVQAGPGHFRSFARGSRYVADGKTYTIRPDSTHFDTKDFSRNNEDRHRWNRIDTFQTPYGHSGIKDSKESNQDSTTVWSGDLRALLGELLGEIRYEFQMERASLNKELDQAIAAIHAGVRSRSEADMAELKSFVAKVVGESESEMKNLFQTDSLKESTKVACQIDVNPLTEQLSEAMSSVEMHMKAVVDHIHVLNEKLEGMPNPRAQNNLPDPTVVKVDIQPVFYEIQKLNTFTENISQTFQSFKPAFEAIAGSKISSDMASVLNVVGGMNGKLAEVSQSVANLEQQQVSINVDPTPVYTEPILNAIRVVDAKVEDIKMKSGSQSQAVMQISEAIAKMESKEMNPPAIQLMSDTGPFLDAVGKLDKRLMEILTKQQPTDLRPMLDQLLMQVSGDIGHVLGSIATLEAKVSDLKKDMHVDLQPVMDQIKQIESRPKADMNDVIKAVANIKPSVDMGAVIDAIYKIETPMVDAIAKMDVRPQVNLQPVLDGIASLQQKAATQVDFAPVLSAIQNIRLDVPDNMLPVFNAVAEVMQHLQNVSTPQLQILSERLSQVDISLAQLSEKPGSLAGSASRALRQPRCRSPEEPRGARSGSRSPSPIRVGGGYELQREAAQESPREPKMPEGSPQYIQGRSPPRRDYVVGSYVAGSAGGGEVIRPNRKVQTDLEGRTVNLYRVLQPSNGRPDPGPPERSCALKVESPTLETWYR